ncbi:glycoside hydrolase family 16 [human gut metagenome]|uniref:Glycoside hydrolase family 16 n=2 Tax=root TaxID=1 RepID=K1U3L8_9ZZZZ
MEHVGKTPGQVTHALHTQNANGNNGRNWNASTALAEAEGSWNTYGLLWEQESDDEYGCISFYVNGERSAWKYQPRNADMAEWPFDNYFYVILNLAIGGTMGGQVDDAIFDNEVIMKVDYVRMWTPNTAS